MHAGVCRMLGWHAREVFVLGLLMSIIESPAPAQSWFGPAPPTTAYALPKPVYPAVFDPADFEIPMPDLKTVASSKAVCGCGGTIHCECGLCDACCGCTTGWRRWISPWVQPWKGTLELGLNGASGNTNNSNLFIGWDGRRDYRDGDLSFDFDYFFQRADSVVTMERAVALGRYEREIGETSVNWYVQGFFEYDDLRAYPARLAVTAGLSKQLIDADRFKLTGRAGIGASKKIDAPDDRWRPELQFGVDYEYRLTERQKILGFVDYFPDVTDFSTYRLNAKLAWEALLEEEWGLAMRASLMNWYDTDPGPGTKANDLFYVLSLVWGY
jgi:putative salt-induced outer membrane protein YdiY